MQKQLNNKDKQYQGVGLVLAQDCALSVAASLLSILLARWLSEPISGFSHLVLVWIGISLVATLLGALVSGSYKVVRRWATIASSANLILAIVIKETILSLILIFGLIRLPSTAVSVLAILSDAMLTVLLLLYIRFAARMFSRSEVSRVKAVTSRKNALVSGTGKESVALARELIKEYNVVGFITDDQKMSGRVIMDIVVHYADSQQDLERLAWVLGGVDCVFFPRTGDGGGIKSFNQDGKAEELVVADGMSLPGRMVKRSFDLLASSVLMIIFSPLALLSAIAVKLEDGGPVLYRQERIGKGGKPFNILKFRSMRTDAEAAGAQLYSGEDDPRLTRVGAFLRKHHLDELPQLWNVFCGDMSFIGYRPERQVFISRIMEADSRYRYLYQIRPGVTSYATLYNGYTDTLEKMLTRLNLDLYYLRHHSVLFDLRVLGLTFLSIVSGKKF